MQYKPETEKVAMMAIPYTPVIQSISPIDDPQIQRTRRILSIILGICLALSVVSLVSAIFGSSIQLESETTRRGPQIGQALVSILFYAFGLYVTHRYSVLGLRIFAWLSIIAVVVMGIGLVFAIFISIVTLIGAANIDDRQSKGILVGGTLAVLFAVGVCMAALILSVIIIKFAFKLARLIDASQCVIIQQS